MAEEDSQEEGTSEVPAGGPPPAPETGGSKLLPIIIIVVVLLMIVGGVAAYFFVFSDDGPSVEATSPEEAKFIEQYNLRSQPSVESIKNTGEPVFSRLFTYEVNMKDGRHMMKLSWKAMLYDDKAKDYLNNLKPSIDNNMLVLLRDWKAEDLRNRSGLELLKRRIYRELNGFFDQAFIELPESKDRTPVKDILIVEYYIN
jgi:flagellar FliL protein